MVIVPSIAPRRASHPVRAQRAIAVEGVFRDAGLNEGDVSLCSRKQKERKRPPRSVPLVLSLPLSKNGVMTQSDVPSVVRLW